MADAKVPLYKCLYSMELFKGQFVSDEAETNCLYNAINFYSERHLRREIVGAVDFNRIIVDLNTGELSDISPIQLNSAIESVDTMKFLPPEIINGNSDFGELQDRYCLAVLLFAIRYFSNPFDGENTYTAPIVNVETAKKIYGAPVFVFDIVDSSNAVSFQTDSRLIQLWENETNVGIKDLFTTCFTAGVKNVDMRPDCNAWLESIGGQVNESVNNRETLFLEVDGRKICLEDGVEVFESDLYEGGSQENKVAVVLKSKKSEDILALGNASGDTWSVYMPDSREIMVTPKSVAPLVKGSTISIGDLLVNIISEER